MEERKSRADELAHALSLGDLPENSAMDAAKERTIMTERRINAINEILRSATAIDFTRDDIAQIGTNLTIEIDGRTKTIALVSPAETNPLESKISIDSEIGKQLAGKPYDTLIELELTLPNGRAFKIIEIH